KPCGFETMQRRIQRPLLDAQQAVGLLMDLQQGYVPVPKPAAKQAQDEEDQRSIGQRRRCGAHTLIARVIVAKPSCLGKSAAAGPAEYRPGLRGAEWNSGAPVIAPIQRDG